MMKDSASCQVALIGDLVGSRDAPSRAHAQQALVEALEQVNEIVPSLQPLEPTIGDELQSVHASLDDALRASLLVRLALPDGMDARFGLGVGTLEIVGASAYGLTQDGPAWWAARAAIDEVKRRQRRTPGLRTWIEDGRDDADDETGRRVPDVKAYLLCRDEVVSDLDARQRRIALGLVRGRTLTDVAELEGVSVSAISQRSRGGGIAALLESAGLVSR